MLISSWSKLFFFFFLRLFQFGLLLQTHKVIMSCSCYHLLSLQLEPLAEDVLHQTPNMNAVISLQKIIEIQSMSSNFLIFLMYLLSIYWELSTWKIYLSFSNIRNRYEVVIIWTYCVFIPKCVIAMLFTVAILHW